MAYAQKQSGYSLEAYSRYILHERRAKYVDVLLMSTIYERAIAEAAKRLFKEEAGAELALRTFWCGYLDTLVGFLSGNPLLRLLSRIFTRESTTQMSPRSYKY